MLFLATNSILQFFSNKISAMESYLLHCAVVVHRYESDLKMASSFGRVDVDNKGSMSVSGGSSVSVRNPLFHINNLLVTYATDRIIVVTPPGSSLMMNTTLPLEILKIKYFKTIILS